MAENWFWTLNPSLLAGIKRGIIIWRVITGHKKLETWQGVIGNWRISLERAVWWILPSMVEEQGILSDPKCIERNVNGILTGS